MAILRQLPLIKSVCRLHSSNFIAGRSLFNTAAYPLRSMEQTVASAPRDYPSAVALLNSLQTNAATLERIRRDTAVEPGGIGASQRRSLPEMVAYLQRVGHEPSDLNQLQAIHVAGTKGKGSTCAFIDSILRRCHSNLDESLESSKEQSATAASATSTFFKTGLYTSPHLIAVRERIRINGLPLEPEIFARYFFEVWDALEATAPNVHALNIAVADTANPPAAPAMPTYFRFMTLLAYHVFLRERVNVAIVEVGIGGSFDATNILERPACTAVTSIGHDHQAILGNTLPEIAWHKAGIFKKDVPAIVVRQMDPAVDQVFVDRARELGARGLEVVDVKDEPLVRGDGSARPSLGLAGDHQRMNAALAVRVCRRWLEHVEGRAMDESVSEAFRQGLRDARWPGRAQILRDRQHPSKVTYFLDGAHTAESLEACASWWHHETTIKGTTNSNDEPNDPTHFSRILVFNCTAGRDPLHLLQPLIAMHRKHPFHRVLFTTNDVGSSSNAPPADLTNRMTDPATIHRIQIALKQTWDGMVDAGEHPCKQSEVCPSIDDVVARVREEGRGARSIQVLVTGSLHLIGGMLTALGEPVT